MSSKAITEKPESSASPGDWNPLRETAPSTMRVDEPALGRIVGFIGLMCLALGGTALLLTVTGAARGIGPTWGAVFVIAGLGCVLFHAACDNDMQIRRIYGLVGFLWLVVGVSLTVLPIKGSPGAMFLPYGYSCWILGLFFLLPFARHETDPRYRQAILICLGGGGGLMALVGFIGGNISEKFLAPYGLLLVLLGLAYLWAFLTLEGNASDLGFRIGRLMGLGGALALLVALGRTVLPQLFYGFGWANRPAPYFIPYGLLLSATGFLYLLLAVGLLSERRLVVLTRRELGSFFYSPIAYLVLFGVTGIGWLQYWWFFIGPLAEEAQEGSALVEPIIRYYLLAWGPVICLIVVVPLLTMRLLSEEKRTGTLEVLLTAPVDEFSVVMSKFLAVWGFFMLLWVPWSLLLLGLLLVTGKPFEYRPLINFYLVLGCTGAGFLSIGMFFSALTRNQVISAVLTFAVMLVYLMAFLGRSYFRPKAGEPESFMSALLGHISFIDLWISALQFGLLNPQHLIYHLSAAVFGLFLSVKVLEARKWL